MTIQEAKDMLEFANFSPPPQCWLDLGCGNGTFTLALAELLPKGSKIIGIDQSFQNLPKKSSKGIDISFLKADFSNNLSVEGEVHGMMMANSLHYVKNKRRLISHLISLMNNIPQFLLIEYDTDESNPWVPFPIKYNNLKNLFSDKGIDIQKIGERKSIYGGTTMYAAKIQKV